MARIDRLCLEVTRRCNMMCGHCLRGGAQRVDMTKEIANTAIRNFEYIGGLTFTGGEPLLNVPVILHAIDTIIYNRIDFNYFYIVTNGKKYSQELVDGLGILYQMAGEQELCGLTISRDQYHKEFSTPAVERNYWKYEDQCLPFFRHHDKDQFYWSNYFDKNEKQVGFRSNELIPMGRAKNKSSRKDYQLCSEPITRRGDWYDGLLYVNALGDLSYDCDLSYVEQNNHKIGTYDTIDYFLRSIPDEEEKEDDDYVVCNEVA